MKSALSVDNGKSYLYFTVFCSGMVSYRPHTDLPDGWVFHRWQVG
jgi:hypothetical protein